jgi:hypothetical protein
MAGEVLCSSSGASPCTATSKESWALPMALALKLPDLACMLGARCMQVLPMKWCMQKAQCWEAEYSEGQALDLQDTEQRLTEKVTGGSAHEEEQASWLS